jgi:hypothetical protein
VLVRGDAAAGVQALLHHLTNLGLQYSVGINARQPVADALAALPRRCWRQAIDAGINQNPIKQDHERSRLTQQTPSDTHNFVGMPSILFGMR